MNLTTKDIHVLQIQKLRLEGGRLGAQWVLNLLHSAYGSHFRQLDEPRFQNFEMTSHKC